MISLLHKTNADSHKTIESNTSRFKILKCTGRRLQYCIARFYTIHHTEPSLDE